MQFLLYTIKGDMESNLHAWRRQNMLSSYLAILFKILLFVGIVLVAVKLQT